MNKGMLPEEYLRAAPSEDIVRAMYGGWKLCVSSGKQVHMTVKIKFCPICGRRLEG